MRFPIRCGGSLVAKNAEIAGGTAEYPGCARVRGGLPVSIDSARAELFQIAFDQVRDTQQKFRSFMPRIF